MNLDSLVRPKIKVHVGAKLRIARESLGLTMRDVEEKTGINISTICNIEKGRRKVPTWPDIVAMAKLYNVSLDDLAE